MGWRFRRIWIYHPSSSLGLPVLLVWIVWLSGWVLRACRRGTNTSSWRHQWWVRWWRSRSSRNQISSGRNQHHSLNHFGSIWPIRFVIVKCVASSRSGWCRAVGRLKRLGHWSIWWTLSRVYHMGCGGWWYQIEGVVYHTPRWSVIRPSITPRTS